MCIQNINKNKDEGKRMLKKLSKYGNSTTLVIDKAILELLNMNESSIVKLKTDGKSLIISPVENKNVEENIKNVLFEPSEAIALAIKHQNNLYEEEVANLDDKAKKEANAMKEELTNINLKLFLDNNGKNSYLDNFKEITNSKEYLEGIEFITNKFNPITQNNEYMKEYNKLVYKLSPKLLDPEFKKETLEIGKKYEHLNLTLIKDLINNFN